MYMVGLCLLFAAIFIFVNRALDFPYDLGYGRLFRAASVRKSAARLT